MLNRVYNFLKFFLGSLALIALYRHLKQQKEMREYAKQVSQKLEKTGGAAILNEDNSVSIIMDGKVQVVLPSEQKPTAESILKSSDVPK